MFYIICHRDDTGGFDMKKKCFLFLLFISLLNCNMVSAWFLPDEPENNYEVIPQFLYPHEPNKGSALICAEKARKIANHHLLKAQLLIDELDNFKDVVSLDRLRNVVGYAICSIAIPDPKAKILSVALSVLADITINAGIDKVMDVYNIYTEISHATIALEHYDYFCRMYFDAKKHDWDYAGSTPYFYVNCAIGELIKADMLTVTLSHKMTGCTLSHYIMKFRNNLMEDIITTGKLDWKKVNSTYLQELKGLLENFTTIAQESYGKNDGSQDKIKQKIYEGLCRARENLVEASDMWRNKS
jgi:hypothetical protein